MMEIRTLSASDEAWGELLRVLPHDIYHLPAYQRAEDEFRSASSELIVVSEANYVLAVPLSFRSIPGSTGWEDASSPYGYPAPLVSPTAPSEWVSEAVSTFQDHLRSRGVVSLFLRFHPMLGADPSFFSEFGAVVEQGQTVAIQLGRSFDTIRGEMRKGTRYDVRKALKQGQKPVWDRDWRYLDSFLEIYRLTMDRVGASEEYYFPADYFVRMRDELGDHVALWVTKMGDDVAAASLITECDGIVQYHLSGTHPEFTSHHPTKVLLDAAGSWANDRGNRWFHLGGGLGGLEDSLFQFKAGFGQQRQSFYTARLVVDTPRFRELSRARESTSHEELDDLLGFFPPYRRPVSSPISGSALGEQD